MATTHEPSKVIHHGRNVRRFREMLNIKQEAFAEMLGEGWSQKKVSTVEAKEEIEQELLEELAKVLNVPADAIKNFNEEKAINIIATTVNTHDQSASIFYNATFSPIDKLLEVIDKNEKLYEALLRTEREKNELFERLLKEKM